MSDVRVTIAVARVLRAFVEEPSQSRYGYELMQVTGFPSGKLYPILTRLLNAGWLTKEIEDIDPRVAGRPARRTYRITAVGLETARLELATLSEQLRPPSLPAPWLRPESGPT